VLTAHCSQGHCHPRLVAAMAKQSARLTLTSRAFFNDQLGPYEKFMCDTLGFDRILPMNTGVEGGETALKLARRWAYDIKGVPKNSAVMVFASGNFWGRTLAAISSSDDPDARQGFGPMLPGYVNVAYNDADALEEVFKSNPNIAGYMVEPIQGEAGVVVPDEGYLSKVRELCSKYNVLMIADEVQTGLSRTGNMLAVNWETVKPDILVLGKALSGGMLPVSAVMSSDEVMTTLEPGQHGSTYGGNPLACAVATEAVKILIDEDLSARAMTNGIALRNKLSTLVEGDDVTKVHMKDDVSGASVLTHIMDGSGLVQEVRGKGMLNALVVDPDAEEGQTAKDICYALMRNGLLAKPTHEHIIRFAPPLVMNDEQLEECADIIVNTIKSLQ